VDEVPIAVRALGPIRPVAPVRRPPLHPVMLFRTLVVGWLPLSLAGLLPYAQALLLVRLGAQRPPRSRGLRLVILAWLAVAAVAAWRARGAGPGAMWPMLATAAGGVFIAMAVSTGMRGPRFVRAVVWLGAMVLVAACVRAAVAPLADALGTTRLFFSSVASAHAAGLGIAFFATREPHFRWRLAGMAGGIAAWLTAANAATLGTGIIGAAVVLFARAGPVARLALIVVAAGLIAAWHMAGPMGGVPVAAALTGERIAAILAGLVTFAVLVVRLMQTRPRPDAEDAAVALGLTVCVTAIAAAAPLWSVALPCLFVFLWIGACVAPDAQWVPGFAAAGNDAPPADAAPMPEARALRPRPGLPQPGLVPSPFRDSSFQARAGRRN
jgi:hypothetical protein